MKTVGVIVELNPLHNGHAYFFNKAKELTDADYCIAIMSGNFVQRGVPAIFDKYKRTQAALAAGADLVLELPVVFATSSAEGFAKGAVSLLDQLGIIDFLAFGCETTAYSLLDQVASFLSVESDHYQQALKEALSTGMSYPVARSHVLCQLLNETADQKALSSLLSAPNNILAIEYIKAIRQCNSSIKTVPIIRQGKGFHSETLQPPFASATALRKFIYKEWCDSSDKNSFPKTETLKWGLDDFIPPYAYSTFALDKPKISWHPIFEDSLSLPMHHCLLNCQNQGMSLSQFYDVSPALANRISNRLLEYRSFSQFANVCKTKDTTQAAINRGLLHILLGIRQLDYQQAVCPSGKPYVRVLGCRPEATSLLTKIKHEDSVHLITRPSKAPDVLSKEQLSLWNLDVYSSHLYQMLMTHTHDTPFAHEYQQSICGLTQKDPES